MSVFRLSLVLLSAMAAAGCARQEAVKLAPEQKFQVEEATIASIHAAIKSGQTTCKGVVQAYIARARAYNGVCTALLTADGADVAPAKGYVRAGSALGFPTKTVKASTIFPDIEQYKVEVKDSDDPVAVSSRWVDIERKTG